MGVRVCQPGNEEWRLPEWCVEQQITKEFVIQGIIEFLFLILFIGFFYMRWKRASAKEAERIKRENEEFAIGRTFK